MAVTIDQNPTIADEILFDLYTTDSDGELVNPYEVNQVIIYFVERNYTSSNLEEYTEEIQGYITTSYYKDATPVQVFGTDDMPAWLSSDTTNAFLTKIDYDSSGNVEIGHFQLFWNPELVREGDYFLCYTWTPIANGDSISSMFRFYLGSAPVPNVRKTNSDKYHIMLDRYTPEMFKQYLSGADISPEVIQKTNLAVGDGFTELENLSNQLIDLLDANIVQEAFLPYLANLFHWKLRSDDVTLWRRQVRSAINLYKKKGTLEGLREVLSASGIELNKVTYYWQVVSKSTWQEAFIVEDTDVFCLSKVALEVDDYNFAVWHRASDSTEYTSVPLGSVYFDTSSSTNSNCENNVVERTCVTVDIDLSPGDVVKILYKIAEPEDQQIETYIQSLDLADQRDELTVTYPVKNWNVRLIADDDAMFNAVIPIEHPFAYPVVYGMVRSEFPYSEKIYNLDEYNACCSGETLVVTENGMKKIRDINEDKFILTEFGFRRFESLRKYKEKDTLNIRTKMGRYLNVTPNHKFKIINEDGEIVWKESRFIEAGDYLLGKRGRGDFHSKNKLDKNIWYLVGFAYGDGTLFNESIKWLIPEGEEESKQLIELILKENNAKFNIRERTPDKHKFNTKFTCNKSMFIINTSLNQLPKLKKILPKYEKRGKWKSHLPYKIWNESDEHICSFLRGLFDTDGTVQKGNPQLTTKWKSLAEEIQSLLLMLGIISSIGEIKTLWDNEYRTYYILRVFGKRSVKIFIDKIGFNLTRKATALKNKNDSINVVKKPPKVFCSDRMIIPYADKILNNIFTSKKRMSKFQVKDRELEEKQTLGLICRVKQGYCKKLPDNRVESVLNKAVEYTSKNKFRDLLENYIKHGWFFDKVTSVNIGGKIEVFDPINVEETKSYLTFGIVSHNSSKDSENPCDLDYTFYDVCSACRSSKISLDVTIEDLSNDRISEAEEIIKSFVPFHAVLHSINYYGLQEEIIPPPVEELECLIQMGLDDNLIMAQFDFDRIVLNGKVNQNITRDMLADVETVATASDGTGYNLSYSLFSPQIKFDEIGINDNYNLFEILSGTAIGDYSLLNKDSRADVIGISMTDSGFLYRFSNGKYEENSVDIFQDNVTIFSDIDIDFSMFPIPDGGTWAIEISSVEYPIFKYNPDNTLILSDWTGGNLTGISYNLLAPGSIVVTSGTTGVTTIRERGRVEAQYIPTDAQRDDYVLIGSDQFKILFIDTDGSTYSNVYIEDYGDGDQTANIKIYRRLIDNAIGYITYRGMKLTTTTNYEIALDVQNGQNPPTTVLENSAFKENFFVVINSKYYQMIDIDGNDIYLSGTLLDWGIAGTPGISYSIIQFVKHVVSIQSGLDKQFRTFDPFVDRRGDGSNFVTIEPGLSVTPMMLKAQVLNESPSVSESVTTQEDISYTIITKA